MTTVDYFVKHSAPSRAVVEHRTAKPLYLNWIFIVAVILNTAVWAAILMAVL